MLIDEAMRVETVAETGPGGWTLCLVGTRSERFRQVSLGAAELTALTVLDSGFRYNGGGALLRLGLQEKLDETLMVLRGSASRLNRCARARGDASSEPKGRALPAKNKLVATARRSGRRPRRCG